MLFLFSIKSRETFVESIQFKLSATTLNVSFSYIDCTEAPKVNGDGEVVLRKSNYLHNETIGFVCGNNSMRGEFNQSTCNNGEFEPPELVCIKCEWAFFNFYTV